MRTSVYFRILALLLLLMTLSLPGWAQYSRLNSNAIADIDSKMETMIQNDRMAGGSIGIVKDGEIVFLKGYGKADVANDIDADECTVFRIGSVSKLFTSTLAMQLYEEGKLDLEQDVTEIVPEFPPNELGTIRVKNLLNHTSGLDEQGVITTQYALDNPSYNAIAAVDLFATGHYKPNNFFIPLHPNWGHYSNYGYNLLGAVLQRVGDGPYEQMINDRIVKPANMPLFDAEYMWKTYPNQSKLYEWSNNQLEEHPFQQGEFVGNLPSGGHVATAADLALFAKHFGLGTYFNAQTRDTMLTWRAEIKNKGFDYGYGISIYEDVNAGKTYYYHGGGIPGGTAVVYFSPDLSDAVVVLANSTRAWPGIRTVAKEITADIDNLWVDQNGAPYQANNFTPSHVNISNHTAYNAYFKGHTITASSQMHYGYSIRLEGGAITLTDGFYAESGTDFLAHAGNPNDDCSSQNSLKTVPQETKMETNLVSLEVFPNPSQGPVTFRGSQGISGIEIFDLYGRQVFRTQGSEQEEVRLNLRELPSGTYLARVTMATGESQQKRFVLSK